MQKPWNVQSTGDHSSCLYNFWSFEVIVVSSMRFFWDNSFSHCFCEKKWCGKCIEKLVSCLVGNGLRPSSSWWWWWKQMSSWFSLHFDVGKFGSSIIWRLSRVSNSPWGHTLYALLSSCFLRLQVALHWLEGGRYWLWLQNQSKHKCGA